MIAVPLAPKIACCNRVSLACATLLECMCSGPGTVPQDSKPILATDLLKCRLKSFARFAYLGSCFFLFHEKIVPTHSFKIIVLLSTSSAMTTLYLCCTRGVYFTVHGLFHWATHVASMWTNSISWSLPGIASPTKCIPTWICPSFLTVGQDQFACSSFLQFPKELEYRQLQQGLKNFC